MKKYDDFLQDFNMFLHVNDLGRNVIKITDNGTQATVNSLEEHTYKGVLTLDMVKIDNIFTKRLESPEYSFKDLCLFFFEIIGHYSNRYNITFNLLLSEGQEYFMYHNRGDKFIHFYVVNDEMVAQLGINKNRALNVEHGFIYEYL